MALHFVAPLGAGVFVPNSVDVAVMRRIFADPHGYQITAYQFKEAYLFVPSSFHLSASGLMHCPLNGPYNFSVKSGKTVRFDVAGGHQIVAYERCSGCPHEMLRLLGDAPCALSAAEATALSAQKIAYNVLHTHCQKLTMSQEWQRWLALKVSVVYGKEAIYYTDLYKSNGVEIKMVPSLKKWKALISEWNPSTGYLGSELKRLGQEGR